MNERKWIDIEPVNSSLSAYEISKEVIHLASTFSNSTTRRRRSSSILENQELSSESISTKLLTGLTIVGKHAWQQEEQKGDISTALMIQEQLFISELFKDIQDATLLVLYYRTMW